MNDSVLIWEKYSSLHEANLISKDPLHLELEKLLKQKNVQKPEIVNWFLKTYIKWFQSPADDNIKTPFISKYTPKETDPDWAKKEGIFQFNNFTSEYKDRLNHLIDFLNTKDDNYLKSLYKVTVPQMFEEVQKWDEEMARSAEKAKKAKLQSVEGTDYEIFGVYDGYPIWKLTSNKSFREESMYMGNCVGQASGESKVTSIEGGESKYFKQYKQGQLIIYSLRDPKEHNHPKVTFELQKDPNDKIVQIKGPANREVSKRYRKACREFIENNNLFVEEDGENIGMVNWKDKYYFEDSKEFQQIYVNEIVPKQKKVISEIMSNIKNGVIKSLNLDNLFLRKLPDFSNVEVVDFFCNNNQLTTLEGAPQEVGGYFSCNNNQLTTLEGAPQEVGVSFSCENNQLTTLEGAPQEVGGDFYCDNNQLTTLEGAPQEVGGDFDCNNNQLITLEGSPQKVGGSFSCNNNQLTTLEGAPQEVRGSFYCRYNPVNFTQQDIEEAQERSRQKNQPKLESFKNFFYRK